MSVPKEHKRYSFDGDVVHIELTEDGYMPPETARYYVKTRTATQDQSVVGGYCGIRDFDAYISPTKYKAYRNNLPNRNGAPYDYVPYMKRRHEIPCGRPQGNVQQNAAPVSNDPHPSEEQQRNSYESRKSSIKNPYPVENPHYSHASNRNSTVERNSVEKTRNSYVADRVSAAGQLSGHETGNSRPLSMDKSSIEKTEHQESRKSSVDQKYHKEDSKRDSTGSNRNSTGSHRNSAGSQRNSTGSQRNSTGSQRNSTEGQRNSTGSNRVSTENNN